MGGSYLDVASRFAKGSLQHGIVSGYVPGIRRRVRPGLIVSGGRMGTRRTTLARAEASGV